VRYIGIDAPEIVHSLEPGEQFGEEATEKNRELVEGRIVSLERDVTDRDEYGRLLRYVWLGDVMINAELVRLGYAYSYSLPPNVKYQELFLRLEREAREQKLGLWSE
jgi:micrococcal nuclease